jgi:hypothetical protein
MSASNLYQRIQSKTEVKKSSAQQYPITPQASQLHKRATGLTI